MFNRSIVHFSHPFSGIFCLSLFYRSSRFVSASPRPPGAGCTLLLQQPQFLFPGQHPGRCGVDLRLIQHAALHRL